MPRPFLLFVAFTLSSGAPVVVDEAGEVLRAATADNPAGEVGIFRRCNLLDVRQEHGAFRLGNCEHLDLESYDLSDDDVRELALALGSSHGTISTQVKLVDLSNNRRITDLGAIALSEALAHNKVLAALELYACSVGDAGAKAIMEAIQSNPFSSMTEVDLRRNPTTAATVTADAYVRVSQPSNAGAASTA